MSRVLLAKPIQRIAGAFEPSREERGDEVVDEDGLSAVEEEVDESCGNDKEARQTVKAAVDDGGPGAVLIPWPSL